MGDIAVVVITGAAQGIGAAVARRLARPDRHLVLIDRSSGVENLAGELDAKVSTHQCDLGDDDAFTALIADLRSLERCDVLVNNAGINPKNPDGSAQRIADMSLESWRKVLDVNLTATFRLSQWALHAMSTTGWGRIVNISSRGGRVYSPAAGPHYAASKAGMIGFTRALAGEGGPLGVTANCVAPGRIATPLTRSAGTGSDEARARFLRETPVGRVGEADEVASTVEYLISDGAAFITGAVIDVNGGSFG